MDDARTVRHPIDARDEALLFAYWTRHRLHHRRHDQNVVPYKCTAIPVVADSTVKFLWMIARRDGAPGSSGE